MPKDRHSALLPAGLADDLPPHADFEADVVARLMATFRAHGYERVKPPLIEFEDSLLAGSGSALAEHTFRMMDPQSQRMLGVRPDMTLQVARIAATRLKRSPRPLRLSYAGEVLRTRGSQLRPERQFAQAGFELIGSGALAADAEAVTLACEALLGVGVRNLSVDVTVPHLVTRLAAALGIDGGRIAALRDALDRKDVAALPDLAGRLREPLFRGLLDAAGPADAALAKLGKLDLPPTARDIVAQAADLVALLRGDLPQVLLTFDPTEYHGFEYHTGISFSLFARGVRGELGRGGRYVLEDGEDATGFSVYLDSLRRAVAMPEGAALVYVAAATARAEVAKLHAAGWRTVRGLAAGPAGHDEARRLGCTHIACDGKVAPLGSLKKHG